VLSISVHKTITICSIYLHPTSILNPKEINQLVDQLPSPYILVGDMDAHSFIWGCKDINETCRKMEHFLFNDGQPTYIHPAIGTFSAIDISLCWPSLFLDINWRVHEDLSGSDHFPTFPHFKHNGENDNLQRL